MQAPQQVLESNDVSVELGNVRVVDAQWDVVDEEVDDVVVPLQDLEDWFATVSNLKNKLISWMSWPNVRPRYPSK